MKNHPHHKSAEDIYTNEGKFTCYQTRTTLDRTYFESYFITVCLFSMAKASYEAYVINKA